MALAGMLGCSGAQSPEARAARAAEVEAGPESSPAVAETEARAEPLPGAPEPGAPSEASGTAPKTDETAHSMLEFIGIGIGERVADLGAGAGYSIELLARAVGSSGVVYSRHDPRTLIAMPSEPARARPAGDLPENLVLMQTPYDAPFMAEAKQLDLVTLLFAYHELMASKQTRKNFNLAVFRALKPGRSYVIAGHAPTPDEGAEAAQRSGRVAESIVKADVEAAGFSFVESADFLSSTARAGATSSATAPSQYLLKFRKPK